MECEVFTRTEARNILIEEYIVCSAFLATIQCLYMQSYTRMWADTPGSSFTIHRTHLWVASHQTVPGCGSAWTSWSWAQRGARGSRRSRGDQNRTWRTLVLQAQIPGGVEGSLVTGWVITVEKLPILYNTIFKNVLSSFPCSDEALTVCASSC